MFCALHFCSAVISFHLGSCCLNTYVVADIKNDLTRLTDNIAPDELKERIYYVVEFFTNAKKLSAAKIGEKKLKANLTADFKDIDSNVYILV